MERINILIVANDYNVASVHAEFLRKETSFNLVGIASDIHNAKIMINRLNPNLIVLENNFLDGYGIDLLKHLTFRKNKSTIDTIFVSTSREIDVLRDAIYLGCFDYLIKPFSYDRLKDSLNRYARYCSHHNNYGSCRHRQVNSIYDPHSHTKNNISLPKGIDELTLKHVLSIFNSNLEKGFSASTLAKKTSISKTTSRRYLEYCLHRKYLTVEFTTSQLGKPTRLYYKEAIQ